MAGKRNSTRRPPGDLISRLPCNIIENILTFLPLHDAARTSILSRKWRSIWVKLPSLVFDDTFCTDASSRSDEELIMIIYQVLLRHHGPILEFTISIEGLMSSPHIDQLILFLSHNGIKDLTLYFWEGEPYKIPSSLFSCLELSHLRLHSCLMNLPRGFKGFNKLICLEFSDIVIDANVLSALISSCALLESLTIENTGTFEGFLKIVAPNLKHFSCEGPFPSLCLEHTPCLESCSVSLKDNIIGDVGSNLVKSFENVSSITYLELDYYYVRYKPEGGVPRQLTNTLNQLKTIKLHEIGFSHFYEISNVLCLIRSSPNLEVVRIQGFRGLSVEVPGPILELIEIQQWSDVCFNHLREVQFLSVSGKASELGFIRILLAKSPVLETMVIGPDTNVSDNGASILKAVTRFRRLSASAEVSYKEASELDPF